MADPVGRPADTAKHADDQRGRPEHEHAVGEQARNPAPRLHADELHREHRSPEGRTPR